ncbi:alpha/beta fold hydrolase [Spirilliplanes yamanashiensis]|uniref:Hydrolase n=1 Tax=Spirilliplanes yamanashiensis TaxID=42233 RepID=A0A8J3Y8I1_9ACTN|nr:alpha/beta hydrolase [Spirilliplanes yamanashiensis]MDP9815697.1 pimeloyl-ACP methyl ester carboxylesterase [Spirilliplanes yamanashiensis]GIJ03951.1 hydrolase [Spirilliplanes yamanashiensis]
MTTVTTDLLDVPGARLHYELRGTGPLLVLVAAPMDARSFAPLADLLAGDHTVLTTDPRGIHRSTVADRAADATPELRADDLARLIAHVDAGPAAMLGSSGGAVSVLALAQARPDLAHTVIAHEPPLHDGQPDADRLRADTERMCATYLAGDPAGAWRDFLRIANIAMPPELVEQVFLADRSPQAVADEHYQFARMLRPTVYWRPDVAALRASPVRVLVGLGEESGGELCERTSATLAARLGTAPTLFPGGHIGFADRPEAFAARLREVLAGR